MMITFYSKYCVYYTHGKCPWKCQFKHPEYTDQEKKNLKEMISSGKIPKKNNNNNNNKEEKNNNNNNEEEKKNDGDEDVGEPNPKLAKKLSQRKYEKLYKAFLHHERSEFISNCLG